MKEILEKHRLRMNRRRKKKNFELFLEDLRKPRHPLANKPLQLHIEITTHCNLRCQKCGKNFDPERRIPNQLPFPLLSEFDDYYKAAVEVNTFGYGEMFLYKDLGSYVDLLKKYDCKLSGITNGTMINKEHVEWLVSKGYDELTFSIDGAEAETMKRLRGADLDKIISTLRLIREEKRKQGSGLPRIIVNFVAQKDNFHELPDLVRMLSDLDVLFLGVNTLHLSSGEGRRYYYEYSLVHVKREDFEAVMREARLLAEKAGIQFADFVDLDVEWQRKVSGALEPQDVHIGQPRGRSLSPFYCLYPWMTIYLAADRTTKVCCFMQENLGKFSSVSDLDEIWHGEGPLAGIRGSIGNGSVHPSCKVCVEQGRYKSSHSLVEALKKQLG